MKNIFLIIDDFAISNVNPSECKQITLKTKTIFDQISFI